MLEVIGVRAGAIASLDEGDDAPLQHRPCQENAVLALLAANPDIRPQAHDLPTIATAGVRLAQLEDVADVQLHHRPGSAWRHALGWPA
jgi:hypothetical protein